MAKHEFTKVTQRYTKESVVNESKTLSYILRFGFSGLGVTVAGVLKSCNRTVLCKEAKTISDIKQPENPELTFEWEKFLKYLYPYIWYLLLAVSVSNL